MEIKLLSFGQVADITGTSKSKVSDMRDTEELGIWLTRNWPKLQFIKYSVAVNKKVIQENTQLQHEDTVALLPPFSGG